MFQDLCLPSAERTAVLNCPKYTDIVVCILQMIAESTIAVEPPLAALLMFRERERGITTPLELIAPDPSWVADVERKVQRFQRSRLHTHAIHSRFFSRVIMIHYARNDAVLLDLQRKKMHHTIPFESKVI